MAIRGTANRERQRRMRRDKCVDRLCKGRYNGRCAKADTIANCARADAMAVHIKADAIGNLQRGNLQLSIYNRESAIGNSIEDNKREKNQM